MSAVDQKPTKARTLDDCAAWPTVFAITCHECGGVLGDARGPRCADCQHGMGVELTAKWLAWKPGPDSPPDPGSHPAPLATHAVPGTTPGVLGRYRAVDHEGQPWII